MRFLNAIILVIVLFANPAQIYGFGFNLGPFNMQFGVSDNTSTNAPICEAIYHQQRLEIVVEGRENVSTKEKKITTKRLLVEPQAFGIARDGKPIFLGTIVNDELIKEVSVKFGDENFDETSISKGSQKMSAKYTSGKNKQLDIHQIVEIHVIPNTHFDVPKGFKGFEDKSINVICQLPYSD